jgi:hypothetical protein
MSLPVVHTVWIGDELPMIAQLTMLSYLRVGHPVVLHSYAQFTNIPDGVQWEDAEEIMPKTSIFRHAPSGSFAVFCDLFRYRLLASGADIYSDLDVFCLKPFPRQDWLMGWQEDGLISNGLLSLPTDSQTLKHLLEISPDTAFIPPWLKPSKRRKYRLRKALGVPVHLKDMSWGATGPDALTWFARQSGEARHALPQDVLYPIAPVQVDRLLDPALDIDDLVTHRSLCIHLYNEMLRKRDLSCTHPDSPLGRMMSMFDIPLK